MDISGTILGSYAAETGDEFVIINMIITDDGYGGQAYQIVEGLHFNAILILNNSIQTEVAQKQGATGIYTFAYPKNYTIPARTVIRRVKDSKYFRTTDLDGNPVPDISSMPMKVTRAEDYTLPDDIIII